MKDFGSLTEIFSIQTTKAHTRSHSAEVGSLGDYLGGAAEVLLDGHRAHGPSKGRINQYTQDYRFEF